MRLTLLSGSAHPELSEAIAAALSTNLAPSTLNRFPDTEAAVEVGDVHGADVFILQPTSPPVDEHLIELALLADASRRSGAARITAVVPYFGYARQDRRSRGSDAVGSRLAADLLQAAGVDRLVVVDLHAPAIEGDFHIPVSHLSAMPLLMERARAILPENAVVVAPDLGAAKLAERFARELGVPAAFVHKTRVSGTEVEVHGVTGEVTGREPLIVDDMISTAGTVLAAATAVLAVGALPRITVCASHGLFAGSAVERLLDLGVKHVIVSDSVAMERHLPIPLDVVSLGGLIAGEIRRLSGAGTKAHQAV